MAECLNRPLMYIRHLFRGWYYSQMRTMVRLVRRTYVQVSLACYIGLLEQRKASFSKIPAIRLLRRSCGSHHSPDALSGKQVLQHHVPIGFASCHRLDQVSAVPRLLNTYRITLSDPVPLFCDNSIICIHRSLRLLLKPFCPHDVCMYVQRRYFRWSSSAKFII